MKYRGLNGLVEMLFISHSSKCLPKHYGKLEMWNTTPKYHKNKRVKYWNAKEYLK